MSKIEEGKRSPSIAIIGAGFAGIGLAIRLKQAGYTSVRVFEGSDDVGGTWFKNSYPGSTCDVPSHLYSFSFAPKSDWTWKYARQPEILQYMKDCVDRFGIREQIELNSFAREAKFDSQTNKWQLQIDHHETPLEFDVVVSAVGQLNRPQIPEFPNQESFQGEIVHSACWRDDIDVTGKEVAIIGTGASAVQIIPQIAPKVKHLTVFQRSPNWVASFRNYQYSGFAKSMFRSVPLVRRLYRLMIFLLCEYRFIAFLQNGLASKLYTRHLTKQFKRQVPESLQEQLLPDFPPGCKRIPLSNTYYSSLARPNVTVVTDAIESFEEQGIVAGRERHSCDLAILATGFKASELILPLQVQGKNGTLSEEWKKRAGAYLGMLCPGFPNFFMLYGPNTNLGHNSIVYMLECQFRYVLKCLDEIMIEKQKPIEVARGPYEAYLKEIKSRLGSLVWNANCTNWYKTADGKEVNNWCGWTLEYRRRTKQVNHKHFVDG